MSRITPHVPMTALPLAGEAEVAAMMEKLRAKVSKGSSGVESRNALPIASEPVKSEVASQDDDRMKDASGAGSSAPPAAPPLKWDVHKLPKARGYYSLCKRYSVCSITVAGHEYYEAYKLAKGGCWFTQIARGLKSFAEAEAACEAENWRAKP